MGSEFIVFLAVAIVAIGAAAGMALSRNALYSAMFLILNFACVAVLYLLLNAPFLAVAQVTVYTGAIMVLFVFVIMVLGAEKLPAGETRKEMFWQRPLALGLGVLLLIQAAYVSSPGSFHRPRRSSSTRARLRLENLFGPTSFRLRSPILLLAAMVGAVVLTRKVIGMNETTPILLSAPVLDRRDLGSDPPQRHHDLHVGRAHAQCRQPRLCGLCQTMGPTRWAALRLLRHDGRSG
jgi:NADH-quinone oxidoreductase subunit J